MTAALGHFTLIVALLVTCYGAAAFVVGTRRRLPPLVASAERSVLVSFGLVTLALLVMEYALVTSDFSIRYVAGVSTRASPVRYKIAGLWGNLEGSILLWEWLQVFFIGLAVWRFRRRPHPLAPYALAVLLTISAFFLFLLAVLANPFQQHAPVPPDGRGLNPLLEVTDMLVHPLLLYHGYVGFSVPFAFAIAALLTGRLENDWLTLTRRWTVLAWLFLTAGILYGGWWSYRTLGWGGYWAWDPVENASFMPWLTGTAFLHSVMIQEKRGMLKVWNLVLITLTFALVIFGTFLTRSGILASVHAFAEGPVGIYFLGFLGAVILAPLGLLLWRAESLKVPGELDSLVSRESAFLLNNLLLVAFCFTVFLGTIFPLLAEAARGVKVSVGAPFFDAVNAPLGLALLFLMGVGPVIPWRRASWASLRRTLLTPVAAAVAATALLTALGVRGILPLLGFVLPAFVAATVLQEFSRGVRARRRLQGEGWGAAFRGLLNRNRRRYGGLIVHLGVVLATIGIAGSSTYRLEREAALAPGESLQVGRYTVRFEGLQGAEAPTHFRISGTFTVSTDGGLRTAVLRPAQRFYEGYDSPFATVDARYGLREDLYLILAAFARDGSQATVKALVNPLISWIWLGGMVILAGALTALWPGRQEGAP
ncbi:MAG: heme lyase CcmF/NrfE family subunit [candidate division NC10 bacterium]|nr:heme lyase CcmF/NrfE family subunit [candidate division NC10 bacterium]